MSIYDDKGKFEYDDTLRPKTLKQYIGQSKVKEMIDIYMQAARMREESLDHVLLYGPPGLGKTTLAGIIANEMQANLVTASGPAIERPGDLAAILSSLSPGDVLFIDEIHRLPRVVEEILYPAMEDFCIDIVVGKDSTARNIRVDLVPFTLVAATTRYGDLSSPLRDRFGVVEKLEYYSQEELYEIITRTAKIFSTTISENAAVELSKRSRGTPRVANRLFKRIRDFAMVKSDGVITDEICKEALQKLNISSSGLDKTDIDYLKNIIVRFNGGPVGVDAICASVGEERTTIEEVYEPYLLQEGYIKRTARGRVVTEKTKIMLGDIENEDGRF